MKTKTKEVYYCEHCKKHGLSKHSMEYHESICHKNPLNIHPCYTCKNFHVDEGFDEKYYEGGGEIHTVDIPYKCWTCKKQNISLHSRRAEIKGLPEKYPETFDGTDLMPQICMLYEVDDKEQYLTGATTDLF